MNPSEIPTAGQLATMCVRCGVQPAVPRTTWRGPTPKYCQTCRAEVLAEAGRQNSRNQRADPAKREKAYALTQRWIADHPGHRGRSHRRTRYGLAPEHVAAWLEFQGGNCALCGQPMQGQIDVDHDHETGIVRGLLHNVCNANLDKHPDAERYKSGWLA